MAPTSGIAARHGISGAPRLADTVDRVRIRQGELSGYVVSLLFFWLPSPEMAEQRVAARVASGGHNIPTDVIHRRYWLGLQNLFNIFAPIVDYWSLYDNSLQQNPIVIANEIVDNNKLLQIKESCQNKKE